MFEKVNPSHPDKIADRIAGAIVDLAYKKAHDPKIAVEVLIGHGECTVIIESSEKFLFGEIEDIVNYRCGRPMKLNLVQVPQAVPLADNQKFGIRCGDNGIFKGVPVTDEQKRLTKVVKDLYDVLPYDGKFILADEDKEIIACQSLVGTEALAEQMHFSFPGYNVIANPLGDWVGGTDVDTGATNRKLGSDMGDSVTGGGLHGKDLSKADVSVNIYAWHLAQVAQSPIEFHCAIGDEMVNGIPYDTIIQFARDYIEDIGGFEKFAEYGLIR